jgi:tripeptidyl-peptidase-1
VRGYLNIATSRSNIIVYIKGSLSLIGGTSASCPIVASFIPLVNKQKIQSRKGVVGFINPALYSNSNALNDTIMDNNLGAGTTGFSAVPSRDPVTSFGAPDYQKLLNIFMALP